MTKFIRVLQSHSNQDVSFNAKYQNSSPFQFIHSLEITIYNDEKVFFDIKASSVKQTEVLKKILDKFNVVLFCPLEHTVHLQTKKTLVSEILKVLSEHEGFDDFLLAEIQEQLSTIFEWDDSVFICCIQNFGYEEATEITAQSHPEHLHRLGLVLEQRRQDLSENTIETLLLTVNCYARITESSPHFIVANQRICTLIEPLLNEQNHDYIPQLLGEMVEALYKLKDYEKAAPYLVQLHEMQDFPIQTSPKL